MAFNKKEYKRNWMQQRKNAFFHDKSCVKCRSKEKLELDHIERASKVYEVRALWGMSDTNPNKVAEFAKLQVLCYSCHKEKTKSELTRTDHGRNTMYQKGCRCDLCLAAKMVERRAYLQRRREKGLKVI